MASQGTESGDWGPGIQTLLSCTFWEDMPWHLNDPPTDPRTQAQPWGDLYVLPTSDGDR